jgi:hypothetical protein
MTHLRARRLLEVLLPPAALAAGGVALATHHVAAIGATLVLIVLILVREDLVEERTTPAFVDRLPPAVAGVVRRWLNPGWTVGDFVTGLPFALPFLVLAGAADAAIWASNRLRRHRPAGVETRTALTGPGQSTTPEGENPC